DLFSYGVVLYEMATGTPPFSGNAIGAIFDAILHQSPVGPIRLNAAVPVELDRIIIKCLEKDRSLRYQHASETRTDLQRLKRDGDWVRLTPGGEPGATPAVAKRWKVIAPAAAVLAFIAAGYLYFHHTPKLTDKDTIVLADFTNTTGDPLFEGT